MMIDWVDCKLVIWGRYYRDHGCGLGYPTASIEARMKDGCFGNDNKGKRANDPDVPENIAKTEQAVLLLPHDLQAVVNVAYMTGGTREDQAKRLTRRLGRRVSRQRLNEMLDHSHSRIAGVFDGMKLARRY